MIELFRQYSKTKIVLFQSLAIEMSRVRHFFILFLLLDQDVILIFHDHHFFPYPRTSVPPYLWSDCCRVILKSLFLNNISCFPLVLLLHIQHSKPQHCTSLMSDLIKSPHNYSFFSYTTKSKGPIGIRDISKSHHPGNTNS
ncbi:MAG: hypothetical protein QG591_2998 [Planctomycetota bacterium]|nr:hypothetical protein [Planctomycetota bacterium]